MESILSWAKQYRAFFFSWFLQVTVKKVTNKLPFVISIIISFMILSFLAFSLFGSDEYLPFGLSTQLMEVWASMSFIWFIWQQLFSLSRLKKNRCVFNFVFFFLKCDAQFGPFFSDTGSRSGIIANLWVLL